MSRRDESHITKLALAVEAPGKRPRGRPKMRWMDRIKADLRELGIDEDLASDRTTWRRLTRKANPA